jgi:multidrug efflux pump subunit AcrB
VPELADVNSDQQDNGLDIALNIDRSTAARLGINLRRSTTRCTTPSGSDRYRPSTTT